MNKVSAYRITDASLLKYYIFGALIRYTTGNLQNTIITHLGRTILLAWRWRVRQKLIVQLAQCTLARAWALRAPSMQTERLITSSLGQAPTSRRTNPK